MRTSLVPVVPVLLTLEHWSWVLAVEVLLVMVVVLEPARSVSSRAEVAFARSNAKIRPSSHSSRSRSRSRSAERGHVTDVTAGGPDLDPNAGPNLGHGSHRSKSRTLVQPEIQIPISKFQFQSVLEFVTSVLAAMSIW